MPNLGLTEDQIDATQAESRFGSYLCSIIKTSLELAISDRVRLDMFVSHPICDAARNLAGVWGRNVDYRSEILYLPQNATSSHAARYLRGEYARLMRTVQEIAGREVSEADLRRSLQVYNENRALVRALYAVRRDEPWVLRADEAYLVQALDVDEGPVRAAREFIQSKGLYGPVSVERMSGARLPFAAR